MNPAYAIKLETAEKRLKAIQQTNEVAALKTLSTITAPTLPPDMADLMVKTVADIDSAAREKLADHFRQFKLGKQGEAWALFGVEHIHDDSCPFCGRDDVDELGMVTLYGQIFGDAYKAHVETIAVSAKAFDLKMGEGARADLIATVAENAANFERWAVFVKLETPLPDMSELAPLLTKAAKAIFSQFERKRQSPLEVFPLDEVSKEAASSIAELGILMASYNAVVEKISEAIYAATASPATEYEAKRTVDNVKKRIARNEEPGVQKRVEAYLAAKRSDERARRIRTLVQDRLKAANENAADHYHDRVNHYLGRFGVGARITRPTNSMAGNAGQASYSLVIRGVSIARGRGREADAIPSFRNTLSSGDKTTLALAFFLAKLDHDGELGTKVLVFDDPLASHDSHRRGQTVEAIKDLCRRCLQVVVLSHDEFFLREVDKRCAGVGSTAYQIEYDGADDWSAAKFVNLDTLCRARHVKLVNALTDFVDSTTGDPDDVVLKIRQVLETHYRRAYTAYFPHNRNLGQIVRDIGDAGAAHPCHRDHQRLDGCNAATCDMHHGDDAIVVVKTGVDPDALKVIVIDALQLIGARRVAGVPAPAPHVAAAPAGPAASAASSVTGIAPLVGDTLADTPAAANDLGPLLDLG